jgi:hypothetical protein
MSSDFWNSAGRTPRFRSVEALRTPCRQTGSPLADGAVVGSASAYDDAADRRFADQAGLPGPHVDVVAELEEAALACGVDVVGDRGAAEADRLAQYLLHSGVEAVQFLRSEPCGHAAGADFGAEEALVGIDVADTVEQGLVEQRCLDGGASLVKELAEVGFGDVQWLCSGTTEACRIRGGVTLCLFGDVHAHATEAAGIDKAKLAPGTQHEHAVGVRWARHVGIGDQQAAGHAQMHDPLDGFTFWIALGQGSEIEDDVLAHTTDALDGAAGERFGHGGGRRLHRLALAREPDLFDAVARDALVDAVGDGFDFGEFGHRCESSG